MLKVTDRNTRKIMKGSKLTVKIQEQFQLRHFGPLILNFEHILCTFF